MILAEPAILELLQSDANLPKAHIGIATEQTPVPYILIRRVGHTVSNSKDRTAHTEDVQIQVTSVHTTLSAANAINEAIKAVLDDRSNTTAAGVLIRRMVRLQDNYAYDDELLTHVISTDYNLQIVIP